LVIFENLGYFSSQSHDLIFNPIYHSILIDQVLICQLNFQLNIMLIYK